jgi:transposase
MSALNPRRYHPAIGASYASLVARGKTFKRAMTACMRELLMLMNVLVARGPARNPSYST